MKTTMYAIIKKDFRGLAANRRLFIALLIVPLILTIVLPSIFLITIHFIPDDPDIMRLLDLLPETSRMDSLELTLSSMILNYILPVFFLVIPIMTASIMAASAFVGEKERHEEPEHPGIALMKEDFFLGIAQLFKTALNMADTQDGKEKK